MAPDTSSPGRRIEPLPGASELVPAADGGRIHCYSVGSGPTLLLAHGYLLDYTLYRPLFSRLAAAGYRVVAFDQRGHGGSREGSAGCTALAAAADYRTLFERFGIEDATLVGHSMGAFLGLRFCLENPELARRLRRLVLLGANAGAVAEGSLQNRLQIPLLKAGVLPKLWRVPSLGRALVAPLFGRRREHEWLELTRTTLARQDVARSLPLLRAMCFENFYGRLPEIPIETRVLCGALDGTCPSWHSQRLARELPHASLRMLPALGHMLSYEAPEAIHEAITGA